MADIARPRWQLNSRPSVSGERPGPRESTAVRLISPDDLLGPLGVQGRPQVSTAVVSTALAAGVCVRRLLTFRSRSEESGSRDHSGSAALFRRRTRDHRLREPRWLLIVVWNSRRRVVATRAQDQRRRAQMRANGPIESFNTDEIGERDKWLCGICRDASHPVDPARKRPPPVVAIHRPHPAGQPWRHPYARERTDHPLVLQPGKEHVQGRSRQKVRGVHAGEASSAAVRHSDPGGHVASDVLAVNGTRKVTSWRNAKIDHLPVHDSSAVVAGPGRGPGS